MDVSDTILRSFKSRRMTDAQIAAATGLPEHAVRERVRQLYAKQNAASLLQLNADPNEYLIRLEASAIRMTWSASEERRRRGCVADGVTPPDAAPEFCRLVADRCGRSRPWSPSRRLRG